MLTPEARALSVLYDAVELNKIVDDYTLDTLVVQIGAAIRAATEEAIALERAKIKAELQQVSNSDRYRVIGGALDNYLISFDKLR